jgi:hypothetical protein
VQNSKIGAGRVTPDISKNAGLPVTELDKSDADRTHWKTTICFQEPFLFSIYDFSFQGILLNTFIY